uniref:Uncharacterized protein n=1 Tax=Amphimedon queenslandica TaxID=400682 RepID=A0A1X7ST28_AMPQE
MQTDCKESKDTAKRQLLLPKGGFHGTHGTPLDPPLSMLEMILAPPVIVENAGKGRFTAVKGDLESPGQSLNGLLLKYSRVSVSQGKRSYSAKLTAL